MNIGNLVFFIIGIILCFIACCIKFSEIDKRLKDLENNK